MKKVILSVLALGLFISNSAFADDEIPSDTPAEKSAAGRDLVAASILVTVATPVYVSVAFTSLPIALAYHPHALGALSSHPVQGSKETLGALELGPMSMGYGIVLLVEGSGQGLSEFTEETFKAAISLNEQTETPVATTAPQVTLELPEQDGKLVQSNIPLVVRKEYVELQERIETKS